MKLLSIKIVTISTVLTITSYCYTEKIRIINETNSNLYIATAYYRPTLKRIDTDLPIDGVLEIQKNKTIDIIKPIKRGILFNKILFIASLEKKSIAFLEQIVNRQKELQSKEEEIKKIEKNLNFTQKITNQELKKVKKDKDLLKKALEISEKDSKEDILSVLNYPITDEKTYILKIDSNNKLTIESKKEFISPEAKNQADPEYSLPNQANTSKKPINIDEKKIINIPSNNTMLPNKDSKEILLAEKNTQLKTASINNINTQQEEKAHIQKVDPNDKLTIESKKELMSHEPKHQNDLGSSLPNQANTPKDPIKIPSNNTMPSKKEPIEKINNKNTDDDLFIANAAWETVSQFRASNESWIINATGYPLEINQVHSKIFDSLPEPTSNSVTIANNEATSIKPIDIKLLKWRYLLYKKSNENQWRSLWMWPVWSAYIFDENNKIHKYSYAKKGAILTKDSTVTATIYVAVYKYTKGKGALRITPVTAIEEPEQSYKIPYFSNFEQFGYRQLVISANEKTLAVKINEDGYSTLTKKNIPISIGQPNFTITEDQHKKLFLYDLNEWQEKLKNLKAPAEPISLSWFDSFILGKIEIGAGLVKETLLGD